MFGGILYYTIQSLTTKNQVLGCVATAPGCMEVATGLSISHVSVGFLSAVLSLGAYFLLFHKDSQQAALLAEKQRRSQEEQLAILDKVMTPGEKSLLHAIAKSDGILQSTLAYRANLTPGRVSQVLSGFEEQGLISRKPSGRSYQVFLTL